jgi:predicted membrane GTPase involved in stress response
MVSPGPAKFTMCISPVCKENSKTILVEQSTEYYPPVRMPVAATPGEAGHGNNVARVLTLIARRSS